MSDNFTGQEWVARLVDQIIAMKEEAKVDHLTIAQLKAEVRNLHEVVADLRISAEDDLHSIEAARIENARLKAEVEFLKKQYSESVAQFRPMREQVERLTKAGDALADKVNYHYAEMGTWGSHPIVQEWREAKGVQS